MASTLLAPLVLTADEQDTLRRWTRRATTAQALALRARLVLACAEGATNSDIAIEHRPHNWAITSLLRSAADCAMSVAHSLAHS
jgi:hypothetical protein